MAETSHSEASLSTLAGALGQPPGGGYIAVGCQVRGFPPAYLELGVSAQSAQQKLALCVLVSREANMSCPEAKPDS